MSYLPLVSAVVSCKPFDFNAHPSHPTTPVTGYRSIMMEASLFRVHHCPQSLATHTSISVLYFYEFQSIPADLFLMLTHTNVKILHPQLFNGNNLILSRIFSSSSFNCSLEDYLYCLVSILFSSCVSVFSIYTDTQRQT